MITGIIALICIIITSDNFTYKTGADEFSHYNNQENSLYYDYSDKETPDDTYTLKEYHSKLAVFYGSSSLPIYITNVFVSELPKADRTALKNGISVKSRRELNRLMEDYCS